MKQESPIPGWFIFAILFILFPRFFIQLFSFIFLSGFVLVLVGGLILTYVLKHSSIQFRPGGHHENLHDRFGYLLAHLILQVAKSGGSVTEDKRHSLENILYSQFQGRISHSTIENWFSKAAIDQEPLDQICQEINQLFGMHEKRLLMHLLFQIALMDHVMTPDEETMLRQIATHIHFSSQEFVNLMQRFRNSRASPLDQKTSPFTILNLRTEATADEIKKSYRRLCKEHHPDKVSHLGDDFKQAAAEKMSEINAAYNELKKMGRVS